MIQFDKVDYIYQAGTPFANRALFEIDLSIESGSYTALIGHTGSGKSTLLQHLNGLLVPSAGQIKIDEQTILPTSKQREIKAIRKKVGVVFQFPETQLFEETVLKDVAFGPQNFGHSKEKAQALAAEKLKAVGIDESYFERSPFELSGGQMRRVAIAGILAMEPEVLVLDEPTAGLDPKARIEMMTLFSRLHKEGQTLVLVTHLMDDVADFADIAYILEKGEVIAKGKPRELFQDANFLKEHGLGLPKVTAFAKRLADLGVKFDSFPIHQEELVSAILASRREGEHA